MKVIQINNFHYIRGGSETVYFNTGNLLERMGHEVVYFSSKDEKNISTTPNSYFVDVEHPDEGKLHSRVKKIPAFIYSENSYKRLKEVLRKEKPDIAHLHIFYGRLTSSILQALKEESVPIVMSVHEYRMLCPVSVFLDGKGRICEKCASGSNINCIKNKCNRGNYSFSAISAVEASFRDKFYDYKKYINHFIMVSKFIRKKHIQYYPEIASISSVLYNFQTVSKETSNLKKEVDLVYFGRLSREKGVLTLLEYMKRNPLISLKLIGTGPEADHISKFVKKNRLSNVTILGFCKGEVLLNHIQSAKFCVVPSEWYENNPMTVIESLFLGVPVVGADIGGIPEIVNRQHGAVFRSGDIDHFEKTVNACLQLDQQKYNDLQENARKFASENFSEGKHYSTLIEIYNKTISSSNNDLTRGR